MNPRYLRFVAAAALLAAFSLTTACASMRVRSYTDRGNRVAAARTYTWAADGTRATGDPRLDSNPFFERRLIEATEKQLGARGYARVASGGDLVLHYHASVSQRLDAGQIDRTLGVCDGCDSQSMYEAGTILLDFIDPQTNRLVWRAWAEGSIDGMVDNQQWLEEHIDNAVAKIVATLPRRS
jgi:hypothetical protein